MCTLKWSIRFTCLAIYLIAPAVGIGQSAGTSSENQGSITGRITVDGTVRAGVVIELRKGGDHSARPEAVAKVTTSKTGRYLIRKIPPGTYDVLPVTPGVIIPNEGIGNRPGKAVNLNPGEAISDFDFHLTSEGRITGRVLSVDGEPIAGERISLKVASAAEYKPEFYSPQLSGLITNERGEFSISGVPPGKYLVAVGVLYGLASFEREDSKHSAYQRTFYPDATEESKAAEVEVKRGRETGGVDITVGPPLKLYKISGQVVDVATGLGISGVSLGVITQAANGKHTTDQSGLWTTNADGRFLIKGAMAGEYSIYPKNHSDSNSYGEPIKFKVEDGDVTGLRIAMRRGLCIYGTVIVDGSSGAGAAGDLSVLMIYANPHSSDMNSGQSSAQLSADGTFRLSGIRPGTYGFTVMNARPTTGINILRILRVERNGTVLPEAINVNSGEDVTGLTVVVGAGNGVIRGNVKIEGGPLEGVTLYVSYRSTNQDPNHGFTTGIDARGHFVIDKLLPGEYELTIGPMNVLVSGEAGSRTMNRMPTVKQLVNVTPGSEAEATLIMTLRPQ